MGDVTRILLTGATGYLGRAVLGLARAQGVEVVALHRNWPVPAWLDDDGITPLQADLADPACVEALRAALPGVGAVIHCAAHMGGDAARQQADTLRGTAHLLEAMHESGARMVLASSIAVYDTDRIAPGALVSEHSPLVDESDARDPYARAKTGQERLCRDSGLPCWFLRIGVIWGPDRTWHALMGFFASRLQVTLGSDGELPMAHVTRVAQAMLHAAHTDPGATPRVVTVVDDDRPTRARYQAAHRRLAGWPRLAVVIPWRLWLSIARLTAPLGRRRPGLLQPRILRARIMPQRFDAAPLRAALELPDQPCFETLLQDSLKDRA